MMLMMLVQMICGQISFAANRVGVYWGGGAALSSEGQVRPPPLPHSRPRLSRLSAVCPCSRIYQRRCLNSSHIHPCPCPISFNIPVDMSSPSSSPPPSWWTSGAPPSVATLREFTPSSVTTPSSYVALTASARSAGSLSSRTERVGQYGTPQFDRFLLAPHSARRYPIQSTYSTTVLHPSQTCYSHCYCHCYCYCHNYCYSE